MMRLRASALLLVAALTLAGCKSELYSGLQEDEANQMIAALLDAGIPASKTVARGNLATVMVDESRFAEAIAVLNARGLPEQTYDSLGDVFQKEGLVSSPVEERARFIYAMSQELGRTVAEIDGVLSARVHVVLPETDMLGRDFKPSSASVFIRHTADAKVEDFTSQIKMLVANSIEGLSYDNITTVMVPAAQTADAAFRPPQMVQVAGIWVHPESAERLWMTLGGLALLSLGSIGGAMAPMLLRRIRRQGPLDEEEAL